MNKMLVVYNTCGLSGRENHEYYSLALKSILNQFGSVLCNSKGNERFRVVVSDCCCSNTTRDILKNKFGDVVNFNLIDYRLPVNITFNQTVLTAVKHLGYFDSYIFVDSGINFGQDIFVLEKLYELYKSGPYSIVHGRATCDTGFQAFSGLPYHENDYISYRDYFAKNGPYEVPLGCAVNTHVQLHGFQLLEAYGRLIPDIFAGQCTESVMTFLAAAIKTKTVISHNTELEHVTGLDIPSVGFSPNQWEMSGRKRWDHLVVDESIVDIIERGWGYGMGYAEGHAEGDGKIAHFPYMFDKDGFAKSDKLAPYIRDNLFLKKEQFDYDQISSTWI